MARKIWRRSSVKTKPNRINTEIGTKKKQREKLKSATIDSQKGSCNIKEIYTEIKREDVILLELNSYKSKLSLNNKCGNAFLTIITHKGVENETRDP